MKIRSFRDLDAWRAAIELTCAAYKVAAALPAIERFELASQMRRSAVSIPSNVAEGHACGIRKRYRNHVRLAAGSLAELATQCEIAKRVGYVDESGLREVEVQLARTGQLLHGILRSLRMQTLSVGTAVIAIIMALVF